MTTMVEVDPGGSYLVQMLLNLLLVMELKARRGTSISAMLTLITPTVQSNVVSLFFDSGRSVRDTHQMPVSAVSSSREHELICSLSMSGCAWRDMPIFLSTLLSI